MKKYFISTIVVYFLLFLVLGQPPKSVLSTNPIFPEMTNKARFCMLNRDGDTLERFERFLGKDTNMVRWGLKRRFQSLDPKPGNHFLETCINIKKEFVDSAFWELPESRTYSKLTLTHKWGSTSVERNIYIRRDNVGDIVFTTTDIEGYSFYEQMLFDFGSGDGSWCAIGAIQGLFTVKLKNTYYNNALSDTVHVFCFQEAVFDNLIPTYRRYFHVSKKYGIICISAECRIYMQSPMRGTCETWYEPY